MDLVSIIMPCFNSGRFIEESIRSVINQSYISWELLVCDDGSDDNSKQIVKSFMSLDSRIKLVENRYSKGASGARNSCLDEAQGRYIAFLDSDDIWLPEKLLKQLSFMINNNYSFAYTYYETMSVQGEIKSLCKSPNSVDFKKMTICNFIGCLTVMYDSHLIGKCYQPEIRKRNDYALWLTILRRDKNLRAYCLNEITSRYRVNHYGLSK